MTTGMGQKMRAREAATRMVRKEPATSEGPTRTRKAARIPTRVRTRRIPMP